VRGGKQQAATSSCGRQGEGTGSDSKRWEVKGKHRQWQGEVGGGGEAYVLLLEWISESNYTLIDNPQYNILGDLSMNKLILRKHKVEDGMNTSVIMRKIVTRFRFWI